MRLGDDGGADEGGLLGASGSTSRSAAGPAPLPFRAWFGAADVETVITARAYDRTVETLQDAGVRPHLFGERVGRGELRKGAAVVLRAHEQVRLFTQSGRPAALPAASGSAAVAA